jgi:dolichyl-phosphate-mannose--protein O-mannosyl transferase
VHESTKVNLHSHQHKFGRPISGQFEVCGSRNRDNNNLWIAAEGVYLPHEPDAEGERRQEL